ncbi:MAG: hypothetical protein AAFR76_10330 [Planctomycetota bacterium]
MFEFEQRAFACDAAAVAVELSVGVDNAVARDDDRDSVGSVCGADGSLCARAVQLLGDGSVRCGCAGRDSEELVPDGLLEVSAGGVEGEVEGGAGPVEVVGDLALSFVEQVGGGCCGLDCADRFDGTDGGGKVFELL